MPGLPLTASPVCLTLDVPWAGLVLVHRVCRGSAWGWFCCEMVPSIIIPHYPSLSTVPHQILDSMTPGVLSSLSDCCVSVLPCPSCCSELRDPGLCVPARDGGRSWAGALWPPRCPWECPECPAHSRVQPLPCPAARAPCRRCPGDARGAGAVLGPARSDALISRLTGQDPSAPGT